MPSWLWLLVTLLAFGVLQLLALRFALRGDDPETEAHTTPAAAETGTPDRAADDGWRCPQCGAENRPGYSYCRNCASPLLG